MCNKPGVSCYNSTLQKLKQLKAGRDAESTKIHINMPSKMEIQERDVPARVSNWSRRRLSLTNSISSGMARAVTQPVLPQLQSATHATTEKLPISPTLWVSTLHVTAGCDVAVQHYCVLGWCLSPHEGRISYMNMLRGYQGNVIDLETARTLSFQGAQLVIHSSLENEDSNTLRSHWFNRTEVLTKNAIPPISEAKKIFNLCVVCHVCATEP